jgi:hypothetical protein
MPAESKKIIIVEDERSRENVMKRFHEWSMEYSYFFDHKPIVTTKQNLSNILKSHSLNNFELLRGKTLNFDQYGDRSLNSEKVKYWGRLVRGGLIRECLKTEVSLRKLLSILKNVHIQCQNEAFYFLNTNVHIEQNAHDIRDFYRYECNTKNWHKDSYKPLIKAILDPLEDILSYDTHNYIGCTREIFGYILFGNLSKSKRIVVNLLLDEKYFIYPSYLFHENPNVQNKRIKVLNSFFKP